MAKLLNASAYRTVKRPYTRKSKYRKKSFVRAVPHNKIVRFVMGNRQKEFPYVVKLRTKARLQIRHDALEAARTTANRALVKGAPKNYRMRIRPYPHHVLRNNPLAAGAGADRMSTGMKHSFGTPIGIAAQLDEDQVVFEAFVEKKDIAVAKLAMNRGRQKLPCACRITIERVSDEK